MGAGQAEAVQRLQQNVRAGAGEQQLEPLIGQGAAAQAQDGEQQRAPLAGHQQQQAEQQAGAELHGGIAQTAQLHHPNVRVRGAQPLEQFEQGLVEQGEVTPAEQQGEQQEGAQCGGQRRRRPPFAQAGLGDQGKQGDQGAAEHPGLPPEAFRQRQAQRRAGHPAGQQVGQRPASGGEQADGDEARQRHVEHPGHGRQHRPERADEAAEQQAGHAVALEVELRLGQPLRVAAQQRQAADVLVEAPAEGIGQRIAEQAASVADQQGLPEG
ncbi:hypothetical protein D3C78_894280 [compost metagenome]